MQKPEKPATDNGFDFIAPVYDFLSRLVFGNSLRKAQVHWLPMVPPNADVLVLGGGSGWLLSRILTVCQPRNVIYIDASPKMIALAQQKVNRDERVDFRIGTEQSIRPNERVDAVFTPFILDLFSNERLEKHLLPVLVRCLRPDGIWFGSDFLEPVQWWQHALLWSQYRFFGFLSGIEATRLPDWVSLLTGFSSLQPGPLARFYGGMIGSGYWQKKGAEEIPTSPS
ncbi:class I SAM-dependent methyltransferase [Larkinella bovis]|uniref:Class I SAM-dependent methyltransferase n=1 Tax=Larkinella bovis TaxID=683041 RepID=A0ABW0I4J1_9BACT